MKVSQSPNRNKRFVLLNVLFQLSIKRHMGHYLDSVACDTEQAQSCAKFHLHVMHGFLLICVWLIFCGTTAFFTTGFMTHRAMVNSPHCPGVVLCFAEYLHPRIYDKNYGNRNVHKYR